MLRLFGKNAEPDTPSATVLGSEARRSGRLTLCCLEIGTLIVRAGLTARHVAG